MTKVAFGWLSDPAGRGISSRFEELGSRPELELGSLRGGIAGFRLGKASTPVLAASEQR